MRVKQLELETVTPIWTGGGDGQADRLHETGLLGNLRWWYELMLRGVGAPARDPTSNDRSALDAKKYKQLVEKNGPALTRQQLRSAGLCDAAQVFGATGWRRRFQLSVADSTQPDNRLPRPIRPDPPRETKRGWYLPGLPRSGPFDMHLTSLDPAFDLDRIAGLVQFLVDWTALGARNQVGLGVVALRNGRLDTAALYKDLQDAAGNNLERQLPSLQNFFLAAVRVKTQRHQETFNLKYDLRRQFAADKDLRHFVMGTAGRERIAAKVNVSLPLPDNTMRVWGWLPYQNRHYRKGWHREKVLATIRTHLQQNYALSYWHELNSGRDTLFPNNADPFLLLRHLLEMEEAS